MKFSEMNETMKQQVQALWTSYENVRDRLSIRLCDAKLNQEKLQRIVSTHEGDFTATYQVILNEPMPGQRENLFINRELLDHWGLSLAQLRADAIDCELKRLPTLKHIVEIVEDIVGDTFCSLPSGKLGNLLEKDDYTMEDTLYVLTNQAGCNGASLILEPKIMAKISQLAQGDYYVLPSSRHEVIILPVGYRADYHSLSEIVRDINKCTVDQRDFLSNEVQYYDSAMGQLMNARKHDQMMQKKQTVRVVLRKGGDDDES